MREVLGFIFFGVLFISIGIAITLGSWIAHDKRRNNKVMRMVRECSSWCERNCRYLHECSEKHETWEDTWEDIKERCYNCPMAKAVEVWEEQEVIKKRGKQNEIR